MAAKKRKTQIRLVSSKSTGFFYVTHKNPKSTEKLILKKYDPKVRQHVEFREAKMK